MVAMYPRRLLRIVAFALVLSTLSFVFGIAGDLSQQRSDSGTRVVVRIPPLTATAQAQAAPRAP
jgi:hypothetical protein